MNSQISSFLDDGIAPDKLADDGIYSAIMPYDLPGTYYATVVFDNIDDEAFFTQTGMMDVTDPEHPTGSGRL